MTWRPVRQNSLSDKILEENLGRIIVDINHSNIFLDLSSKIMETKAKINKWDLIKHKSFVPQRKPLKKYWKYNLWNRRKYLQMIQILISKIF